ncbi:hypothetical protein, partial [Mycobacterium sp.]|uniref:hypothetical protein n=1 Tax=Mycobacterium sp. TaxID=1785 RepID=UPI003BB60620
MNRHRGGGCFAGLETDPGGATEFDAGAGGRWVGEAMAPHFAPPRPPLSPRRLSRRKPPGAWGGYFFAAAVLEVVVPVRSHRANADGRST